MFITFEGIEGSGKSVQIGRAQEFLAKKGIASVLTREPGGTDFGSAVRRVLLGTEGAAREPMCELLLYLADRYQHLKEVIGPALDRGAVVLSDRYHDATRAYQGAARGVPGETIDAIAEIIGIPEPDRTILLDLEPEMGLERARARNSSSASASGEGRFEDEDLSFHRKVRNAYLNLAERFSRRIRIVEASGTPDEVFARIAPLLQEWTGAAKRIGKQ